VLEHCVKRFRERFDEMAMVLCIESDKPINDSRSEPNARRWLIAITDDSKIF
jgi:hypothetical protein